MHSGYYDAPAIEAAVREGRSREVIGGLWEEIGALQFDFLRAQGLEPHHRLLDIGAGSLRLGRLVVPWLDAGNYFATDLNAILLDWGRENELGDVEREKLPRENLHAGEGFDFAFLRAAMNFGMAQSVFTHLPLNHLRRCLVRAAPHFASGGRLFVTAFLCPDEAAIDAPFAQAPGEIITSDIADPYHCRADDLAWAACGTAWTTRLIGEWGHPRAQQIVEYMRA